MARHLLTTQIRSDGLTFSNDILAEVVINERIEDVQDHWHRFGNN